MGGLTRSAAQNEIYLFDANVLIDFYKADKTILKLLSVHIGTSYVAKPVLLDEVKHFDEAECNELGLMLKTPGLEQLIEASQKRGKLSFYDQLNLIIARDNRWVVVTNEKRLHNECANGGVKSVWGLELFALLVDKGVILQEDAMKIVNSIHEMSPKFVNEDIIDQFRNRIGYFE